MGSELEILKNIGSFTVFVSLLFSIILLIFIILMPFFVYFAQKYAHLCLKELQIANKTLATLQKEMRNNFRPEVSDPVQIPSANSYKKQI